MNLACQVDTDYRVLYRTRDPSELGEIQELARSLLSLIYCRQDRV